jgi:L-asparaginase II
MFFLANLDVDVEVLSFGLALRIDDGLARVEHAVVVHIIQVIIASVVAWIKM